MRDAIERRRAWLLAALALVLAAHTTLGAVTATLLNTPGLARVTCPALYVLSAAYLICYLLARTRALDVAILATVGLQIAVPQVVCLSVGSAVTSLPYSCR